MSIRQIELASAGGPRADWKERDELQIVEHDRRRECQLAITPHAGFADIAALQDRLRLSEQWVCAPEI